MHARHQGLAILNTHSSGSRRVWRRHLLQCLQDPSLSCLKEMALAFLHLDKHSVQEMTHKSLQICVKHSEK